LRDWKIILRLTLAIGLALLVGELLAAVVVCFLYDARGCINGGPFQPGDRVRILAGPHRDRVTRVYVWWMCGSLRVELGEEEKASNRDIFTACQLLREEDPTTEGEATRP
jgi:hypothetical protein